MSQPELEATPVTLDIRFSDASNLPVCHVNAMQLSASSDEFFFTLGVVPPPLPTEVAEVTKAGYLVAQPVFRFAISRDSMDKFLALMAGQYDQQTRFVQRLHRPSEETSEEEVSGNE